MSKEREKGDNTELKIRAITKTQVGKMGEKGPRGRITAKEKYKEKRRNGSTGREQRRRERYIHWNSDILRKGHIGEG